MELMGLAIVVMLIAVGMFFAMKYTLFQKPPEIKNPYVQSELATTFVNTLLSTSTEECKVYTTMKDLFGDCTAPEEARQKCVDTRSYCVVAEEVIRTKILPKTLDTWGKKYEFAVIDEKLQSNYMEPINKDCGLGAERGKAGLFPIPARHGTVNVKLSICN